MKHFKNLKKSYLTNGPAVRVHGNKGKRPKHHLTLQQIKDVIQYILNYTVLKQYIAECIVRYIVHVRAQQRQMQWSYLDDFLDTRALISSFSPAVQRNTKCGSCIRKLQVSSLYIL